MKVTSAIIVGGGICGLTTALSLARLGIDVSVYERQGAISEVGAGLTLWPNALSALKQLGLYGAALAHGQLVESFQFFSDSGLLGAVDLEHLDRLTGFPAVSIERRKLVAMLKSAAYGMPLRTDKTFVRMQENSATKDAGITAFFSDGSMARADILIGCDGFNSAVRQQLFGPTQRHYCGYTCYRGVSKVSDLPSGAVWHTTGLGIQFGLLHVGGENLAWYATANEPAAVAEDADQRKERLLERYGTLGELIEKTIRACPAEAILRNDIYELEPLASWHRGRALVIGDAAHPTTPNLGMGAGLAIEDAVVLCQCLESCDSIDVAFNLFEQRRMSRARQVVRASRRAGERAQVESAFMASLRDKVFAMMLKSGRIPALDRLFSYRL
jgi:2-polyprenyl-6-methoxyphenol hydroxylase-like FAD-dependent oxidoreductase